MSLKALGLVVEREKTQPGRKLVIWLSSGWPMLEGADNSYTNKDALGFFDSITSFSTQMRQARITLYSVDPVGVRNAGTSQNSYYQAFLKGVTKAKKSSPANLALQVLAVQTGGRVFASSNDLAAAIESVSPMPALFMSYPLTPPRPTRQTNTTPWRSRSISRAPPLAPEPATMPSPRPQIFLFGEEGGNWALT